MITVLAATGYTGKLVCKELAKRNLEFRIAGRDAAKLSALAASLGRPSLQTAVFEALKPETYGAALKGARVLINCAGPFTDLGIPVVNAAAEKGIHYLDTTGEQHFIKQVYDRFNSIALDNGSALMPACAFEYALGDAAAALAARGIVEADDISIYYRVPSFSGSRGTKKSIIRAITSPAYVYRDGRHVLASAASEQRRIEFPGKGMSNASLFGGGEILSVPLHVRTRNVSTFMSLGDAPAWVFSAAIALTSAALKTPLSNLAFKLIDGQAEGPTDDDRRNSRFMILCEAKSKDKTQRITVSGNDPYGLTAVICAETAAKLLDADKDVCGATTPARAFGPEMVENALKPAGVEWARA